ncbi:hypothetical protein BpHYR1_053051 [Brachionus plicatilis]|uniref:Uncharacterized protein n=1 Tax=Brachionus plicatilis TaxID=10195 RepID=A0A3M7T0D7_BRAPC|nr:hypothetical protein BpHYR1_053051 [Brachionus plicatilis]
MNNFLYTGCSPFCVSVWSGKLNSLGKGLSLGLAESSRGSAGFASTMLAFESMEAGSTLSTFSLMNIFMFSGWTTCGGSTAICGSWAGSTFSSI